MALCAHFTLFFNKDSLNDVTVLTVSTLDGITNTKDGMNILFYLNDKILHTAHHFLVFHT